MATKVGLIKTDRDETSSKDLYKNFTLNKIHKCSKAIDQNGSKSVVASKKTSNYDGKVDSKSNKGIKSLKKWKNSTKTYGSTSLSSNDKKVDKYGNLSSSKKKSSSTLSLHIAAYENLVEAEAAQTLEQELIKKSATSTSKNLDEQLAGLSLKDQFEFPRQQEDRRSPTPEIQQFTASQKLFTPIQEPFAPSAGPQPSSAEVDEPATSENGDDQLNPPQQNQDTLVPQAEASAAVEMKIDDASNVDPLHQQDQQQQQQNQQQHHQQHHQQHPHQNQHQQQNQQQHHQQHHHQNQQQQQQIQNLASSSSRSTAEASSVPRASMPPPPQIALIASLIAEFGPEAVQMAHVRGWTPDELRRRLRALNAARNLRSNSQQPQLQQLQQQPQQHIQNQRQQQPQPQHRQAQPSATSGFTAPRNRALPSGRDSCASTNDQAQHQQPQPQQLQQQQPQPQQQLQTRQDTSAAPSQRPDSSSNHARAAVDAPGSSIQHARTLINLRHASIVRDSGPSSSTNHQFVAPTAPASATPMNQQQASSANQRASSSSSSRVMECQHYPCPRSRKPRHDHYECFCYDGIICPP